MHTYRVPHESATCVLEAVRAALRNGNALEALARIEGYFCSEYAQAQVDIALERMRGGANDCDTCACERALNQKGAK